MCKENLVLLEDELHPTRSEVVMSFVNPPSQAKSVECR